MDDNSQPDHPTPNPESQAADAAGANGHRPQPTPEELRKRLDELERELVKMRAERDEFKASTYELLGQVFPYIPLTPEEVEDMLHGPRGRPIIEIIEEYERGLSGDR